MLGLGGRKPLAAGHRGGLTDLASAPVHLELMRDERGEFPPVDQPQAVHSARVWHYKYRSLAPLAELPNLETLVIAS